MQEYNINSYSEEELEIAVNEMAQVKDKEILKLEKENNHLKAENSMLFKKLAYALEDMVNLLKGM